MIVDLGETWNSPAYEVRDITGALADAGAGQVTFVVEKPDGTATTSAPATRVALGQYTVDYLTAAEGLHWITITATGGTLGSQVKIWRDEFSVDTYRAFIGIDEAASHLRAQGTITTTADKEQLRWLCQVACRAIEADLGRAVSRRTVTETYDGGKTVLMLRRTPLISVTTVTESGSVVDPSGYVADVQAGLLYRGGQQSPWCWAWGRQNIVVTYLAGYSLVPTVLRKVGLNSVQRMWQTSQQMPHPYLDDSGGSGGDFASMANLAALGRLTPVEYSAYMAHRAAGFA